MYSQNALFGERGKKSHLTTQAVEKGLVELTKERMSFPAQKNLEEGEASENDER